MYINQTDCRDDTTEKGLFIWALAEIAEIGSKDNEKVGKMLRFTTLFTKAHFNEIPDIVIITCIIISQEKRNRNTRVLF